MARKLPPLGEELVKEIEAAWERPQADWARQRLLVVRLIAQHELTTEQIANLHAHGYSTKEIAGFMRVGPNTPHVIMHRARRKKV